MVKPRPIKFTATLDTLNWRGEVETKKYTGERNFENFDSERFMKALNLGELKSLPQPCAKEGIVFISNFIRETFHDAPSDLSFGLFRTIESEVMFGQVKFVVANDGQCVYEWRYVDGGR